MGYSKGQMIEQNNINKLVIGSIFIIVGYLFLANISWLDLSFIHRNELEYQIPSNSLAKSITSLDFKSSLSIIFSPRKHPFLTVLLIALLKILFLPFYLNEFFTIKSFYFLCYLISLICIYRLSLLYTDRKKIFSGIIVLLYALSSPFYYQTLFDGQQPADLVANTFLFLCLYSYICYRTSLDKRSSKKTRWNAVILSLLMAGSFFSKYNVGVFIAFAIAVDLFYISFISKRYSIKELEISYIAIPFCALVVAWFLSPSVWRRLLSYLSNRLAINGGISIEPFYYLKLLFIQNGSFVHSINGRWILKGTFRMRYFYHWGQSAIALFCLLTAYMEMIRNCIRKKCSNEQTFILLPLIYVSINLLFFSSSKYRDPVALISTIPVMWLIVGHQFVRFFYFRNNALLTRSFLRKVIRCSAVALIFTYLFICACLQYFGLNSQIASFMKLNNTEQLSNDLNEVVTEIEKFAVDNNCVRFMTVQQGVSFFKEYFSRLLRYRLRSKSPPIWHIGFDQVGSLRIKNKKKNVLIVGITPLSNKKLFLESALSELGYHKSDSISLSFSDQSYTVDLYSLSYLQFKSAIEHLKKERKKKQSLRKSGVKVEGSIDF